MIHKQAVFTKICIFLIDKYIPADLYHSAQTEWSDGGKSGVIYVLKNIVKAIRDCTYVYGRYKGLLGRACHCCEVVFKYCL